ncbi:MAG: hypothetical protein KKC68_04170 [Candidatus Thermoplasmatota archaeon]|nr:hypothetical protein [Candidatus Thermoplasmatota archaeon]MBU1940947.1 hypothetical protein [Candidatus Thermoplasmatota archaeon]
MSHQVKTTVIGSYPTTINPLDLINAYFSQETPVSWQPMILEVVSDMIQAGIDIITDGQTRDPFIQLFTRKLAGCRVRARTEVIDKIEHIAPITLMDQLYLRSLIPKEMMIKGVLTGPYTLACSCVDMFYHDQQQMAIDFAYALHKEASVLQDHVDIISIDEPFFSQSMPEYAYDLIKIITNGISIPVVLHVCGDISGIVDKIIELPVDILSHEFKASPQLMTVFSEYSFSQKLCFGSVRSDDPTIESVDDITRHISKGIELFEDKIIHIAPDCGQRLLPRDNALKKLINLTVAGEQINAR